MPRADSSLGTLGALARCFAADPVTFGVRFPMPMLRPRSPGHSSAERVSRTRAPPAFRGQWLGVLPCFCFLALCGFADAAAAAGEAAPKERVGGDPSRPDSPVDLSRPSARRGNAADRATRRHGATAARESCWGRPFSDCCGRRRSKHSFQSAPEQKNMIEGVAQFGILMLLLLAGMETDLSLVRRVRRAAASASITGIVLPFVCGFLLGQYLPDQLLPDPAMRLDHVAISRHGAVDLLGEDRGNGCARVGISSA